MQVLEKLVCRFAPPFFLVPGDDGRTDSRPASEPVPPKPPENRSNRRRQAGQPQAPEFFFRSLSPLVFSRLVPSATDPPGVSLRSLSLSLSLPLARLSTARHAFPTHAHFDGPVVLNLKQGGLDPPLLLLRLLHIP